MVEFGLTVRVTGLFNVGPGMGVTCDGVGSRGDNFACGSMPGCTNGGSGGGTESRKGGRSSPSPCGSICCVPFCAALDCAVLS